MLNHYLKIWNLTDPQPLVETATSYVYTVTVDGERAILKLLTPLGLEDESRGSAALLYYDGRGAVRLLRHDEQAQLLEYADGQVLRSLVEAGEDDKATMIIADVLRQLHAPSDEPHPTNLRTLTRWYRALFLRAEREPDSIYSRGTVITQKLLAEPRDVQVLHGDIHHENIRYKEGRGWLAFDPKGLIGERTFDTANTLCNPYGMYDLTQNEDRLLRAAGILADKLEIDLQRLLAFAFSYVCLSASWFAEDNNPEQAHPLRIAEIIEPHLKS